MNFKSFPLLSFAMLSLLTLVGPAMGATTAAPDMIDISAQESLEWYEDKQLYVARGAAKAVHGDTTVEADLLTAHQRKAAPTGDKKATKASGDIDLITAEGNVHIFDAKQQVFGQKAVYNVDLKAFQITGSNLKYKTEKDIVTAQKSLEYDEGRKMALAKGRAIGEHNGDRVEADVLSAQFAQTPTGQMEMTELNAKGNVIITTKDGGISRGDMATHDVKKNIAILSGHVRITRGDTQLAGDKAEVDFATGKSRLLATSTGRVRALLPTSSAKKDGP